MMGPGIVISLFGLLVLGGAIIGYTNTANIASIIAGSASGLGLLASGLGVLRRKELGFVFAPFMTVLLTAFFGYRLVLSGDFIPSGLMGVLGLVALGGYLNEIAPNDVPDGDILIYSNEQEIVHTGVAAGDRVVSKWGIGQLWSHGAWEVPFKYGERIRLARQIDPWRSEQAFVIYAKEREGVDLVEELLEGRQ